MITEKTTCCTVRYRLAREEEDILIEAGKIIRDISDLIANSRIDENDAFQEILHIDYKKGDSPHGLFTLEELADVMDNTVKHSGVNFTRYFD